MNLRQLALLLIIAVTSCNSKTPEGLVLTAQLKGTKKGAPVYLEEITYSNRKPLDTVAVAGDGKTRFETRLTHMGLFQIRFGEGSNVFLVMDETTRSVQLTADSVSARNYTYQVNGSPASEQLRKFIADMKLYGEAFGKALNEYNAIAKDTLPDSVKQQYARKAVVADSLFRNFARHYVDTVQNPIIAMFAATNLSYETDQAVFEKLEARVKKDYSSLPFTQNFLFLMSQQKQSVSQQAYGARFKVGETAPDILMKDPEGKEIPLSSLRGAYVLLDFWASWCGPCRAENPNIVKAYNKYRDRGFNIYSVSLDTDRNRWLKAITTDKLTWSSHVSELKGWQTPVCQVYGINSIPQSYLLDTEGRILAVNLRGAQLEQKLAELFP